MPMLTATIAGGSNDQGIRGVEAEPAGGFRTVGGRDRALESFCAAVWERHEVRGRRPNPRMWPTSQAFKVNWPLLAVDLLVGAWKIDGAESLEEAAEIDEDLLDPPAVPERDWRDLFAAELASHPLILEDLERGGELDGIELVLERANLTVSERLVVRGWLAGDDTATIAADLGWRPQTVILLLRNARDRLQDPRWAAPKPPGRSASPAPGVLIAAAS